MIDRLTIQKTPGQRIAEEFYSTAQLTIPRLARLIDAELLATMQEKERLRAGIHQAVLFISNQDYVTKAGTPERKFVVDIMMPLIALLDEPNEVSDD